MPIQLSKYDFLTTTIYHSSTKKQILVFEIQLFSYINIICIKKALIYEQSL